jgi:hypothetical protein
VEAWLHALGSIIDLVLGAEVADGNKLELVIGGQLVGDRKSVV